MRPGFDELCGIGDRLLCGAVIGTEGHVADDQLIGSAPNHSTGVVEHLVHGHRECRPVPERGVAQAVADEQDRYPGLGEQAGGGVVVGGDHGEAATLTFGRPDLIDGDRHGTNLRDA